MRSCCFNVLKYYFFPCFVGLDRFHLDIQVSSRAQIAVAPGLEVSRGGGKFLERFQEWGQDIRLVFGDIWEILEKGGRVVYLYIWVVES